MKPGYSLRGLLLGPFVETNRRFNLSAVQPEHNPDDDPIRLDALAVLYTADECRCEMSGECYYDDAGY